MRKILSTTLIACAMITAGQAAEQLPRSTPEAQGISSTAILDFVEAADKRQDLHSFMLVRRGHVVAEGWWALYHAEARHSMYSLSKSFTSTAVGLAIAEGKLSLNDEVTKFFPDVLPENASSNLKAIRVSDLLRMSTGQHAEDMAKFSFDSKEPLVKLFLSMPVAHKPGTHFWYNTPATFMASAIVQHVSGMTVLDYLKPRLFEPLGIVDPTWEMKQQYSFGGSGLSIRTEDIARFGQLYLQHGKWNGKQLVPAAWIAAATARQTSNGSSPNSDWDQGYGYQFWRCRNGGYRGDGAFGQFCIVLEEQDAVVAITSGSRDMQGILNLVWDKLLPALTPGKRLKADKATHAKLAEKLADLKLQPQSGSAATPIAKQIEAKIFEFPANEQKIETIGLKFGEKATTLTLRSNGMEQQITCGSGAWAKGRVAFGNFLEQPVAVSGGWSADDVYTVKFCFYETPFIITANLKFADGQLFYSAESNVAFGATKQSQLVGVPR